MARKEYKLRPSLSWSEMLVILQALDIGVKTHVKNNTVTPETVEMVRLQGYFKTFEPSVSTDTMGALLAQLKQQAAASQVSGVFTETKVDSNISELGDVSKLSEIESMLPKAESVELTNEQRYQMLKLRDEKTFSENETKFYLEYGMMKSLKEARNNSVNSEDL